MRSFAAVTFLQASAAISLGACAPAPPIVPPPPASVVQASPPTEDECAGESAVDVVHHAIELSLRLDPPTLTGRGDVLVRARRETTVIALDARGLRVSEVATGAAALGFRHTGDRLCARLAHPLPAGAQLAVHLVWAVPTDRETPHVSVDQIWAGYATSSWMPTRQDPAQRATLSLRILAPAALKVAAVGTALGRAPAGGDLVAHAFTLDRPSPPFLYAFAAGRFAEAELSVDDVKLRALGPEGADLRSALALTAPMLRFLRAHLGAPFPAAEYLQVFVRGDAAQEAAGLSLLSAEALDDVRKDPTEDWIFSHELAHQWFAWLLPCADFAGKGARSEDLRVALEAASGRDLRAFFATWIYASAPDL